MFENSLLFLLIFRFGISIGNGVVAIRWLLWPYNHIDMFDILFLSLSLITPATKPFGNWWKTCHKSAGPPSPFLSDRWNTSAVCQPRYSTLYYYFEIQIWIFERRARPVRSRDCKNHFPNTKKKKAQKPWRTWRRWRRISCPCCAPKWRCWWRLERRTRGSLAWRPACKWRSGPARCACTAANRKRNGPPLEWPACAHQYIPKRDVSILRNNTFYWNET